MPQSMNRRSVAAAIGAAAIAIPALTARSAVTSGGGDGELAVLINRYREECEQFNACTLDDKDAEKLARRTFDRTVRCFARFARAKTLSPQSTGFVMRVRTR